MMEGIAVLSHIGSRPEAGTLQALGHKGHWSPSGYWESEGVTVAATEP